MSQITNLAISNNPTTMTHWDTELHQYLLVLLCPAPISSIWPLDKMDLVPVSGLQSAALGRCAVRPLRNNDLSALLPSTYTGKTQMTSFVENNKIFQEQWDFKNAQPDAPPILFYLTVWLLMWERGKWCDSGQKCWQVCQKWFYVIIKFTWSKQRGKHDSSEERRAEGWYWPPPDPTLRRVSQPNHQSLSLLVTVF